MKVLEKNREKVADVLSNVGYMIMFLVIAIFIGWAVYRLYGYLVNNGFEWNKLLHLCSKEGVIKIFTAYFHAFLWTGPVFCIGWAMGLTGDILERMVPDQDKADHQRLLIALCVVLFSGLMSIVMLIPGLAIYFFVPLLICVIGHEIAKVDDEDDKKAKESRDMSNELEELRRRVEVLEKKLADTADKPVDETKNR